MRLIHADAMHKFVEEKVAEGKDGWANGVGYEWAWALTAVDMQPTIDAVPVVRCGECKRWDTDPDSYGKDDGPNGKCMKSFEETNDDDFCSYGERKDGDGNG